MRSKDATSLQGLYGGDFRERKRVGIDAEEKTPRPEASRLRAGPPYTSFFEIRSFAQVVQAASTPEASESRAASQFLGHFCHQSRFPGCMLISYIACFAPMRLSLLLRITPFRNPHRMTPASDPSIAPTHFSHRTRIQRMSLTRMAKTGTRICARPWLTMACCVSLSPSRLRPPGRAIRLTIRMWLRRERFVQRSRSMTRGLPTANKSLQLAKTPRPDRAQVASQARLSSLPSWRVPERRSSSSERSSSGSFPVRRRLRPRQGPPRPPRPKHRPRTSTRTTLTAMPRMVGREYPRFVRGPFVEISP